MWSKGAHNPWCSTWAHCWKVKPNNSPDDPRLTTTTWHRLETTSQRPIIFAKTQAQAHHFQTRRRVKVWTHYTTSCQSWSAKEQLHHRFWKVAIASEEGSRLSFAALQWESNSKQSHAVQAYRWLSLRRLRAQDICSSVQADIIPQPRASTRGHFLDYIALAGVFLSILRELYVWADGRMATSHATNNLAESPQKHLWRSKEQ